MFGEGAGTAKKRSNTDNEPLQCRAIKGDGNRCTVFVSQTNGPKVFCGIHKSKSNWENKGYQVEKLEELEDDELTEQEAATRHAAKQQRSQPRNKQRWIKKKQKSNQKK